MLELGTVTRDKGQGTEDERGETEKRWKCGEREAGNLGIRIRMMERKRLRIWNRKFGI